MFRTLSGARMVSPWLTALRSSSGATIRRSATPRRDSSRERNPFASIPSSLVRSMSDTAHYILKKGMVGTSGFEPPTTRTPSVCATRLRYVPTSRTVSFAVQQSQYVLQFLPHLVEALPGCLLRLSLGLGRRLPVHRPGVCRKLLASPGNSETFLVKQLADVKQDLEVFGPISPLPGLVLGRRELGKFAFPIPKDMGLYT